MLSKSFHISYKSILLIFLLYFVIPICLFIVNWCNPVIAYFSLVIILFVGYKFIASIRPLKIEVGYSEFFISSIIICVFLLACGQLGFVAQTGDNLWRNAIFHDLIEMKWPVFYGDTYLVYYFCFWLIPAYIGSFFGSWFIANLALFIWSYVGIALICLILTALSEKKALILFTVLFSVLSGANVIGLIFTHGLDMVGYPVTFSSNEGWCDGQTNGRDSSYLMRSTWDAVAQTYNQAIPAYLIAAVALSLKNDKYNVFLFSLLFPFAPIPAIGLFIFYIIYFTFRIYDNRFKVPYDYFNLVNILSAICIIPVFGLFFKNNSDAYFGLFVPFGYFNTSCLVKLVLFYFFEFVLAYWLINKKYKCNRFVLSALITLLLIPLFRIGAGRDFVMNASDFALIILYQYLFLSLKDSLDSGIRKINKSILVYLIICSTTFLGGTYQLHRAARHVRKANPDITFVYYDDLKTLKNYDRNQHFFDLKHNAFYRFISK